jgi:hypothetical protein
VILRSESNGTHDRILPSGGSGSLQVLHIKTSNSVTLSVSLVQSWIKTIVRGKCEKCESTKIFYVHSPGNIYECHSLYCAHRAVKLRT